jgi:hypothetical protein
MKTLSVVPYLLSARFFALFACVQQAVRAQRATSLSIAVPSSERHANVIADGRPVSMSFALNFRALPNGRFTQSPFAAEVC